VTLHVLQDPAENLSLSFDWSLELDGSPATDTISTSTWAVEGDGSPLPTITGEQTVGAVASCLLSGVEAGVVYRVLNTIVSAEGKTFANSYAVRGGLR